MAPTCCSTTTANGHFTDVSKASGVDRYEGFWTGVSWADYDKDGDLDLYVCGYVKYKWDAEASKQTSLQFKSIVPFTLNPSSYPPDRNLLLRNDGGVFHDVARSSRNRAPHHNARAASCHSGSELTSNRGNTSRQTFACAGPGTP